MAPLQREWTSSVPVPTHADSRTARPYRIRPMRLHVSANKRNHVHTAGNLSVMFPGSRSFCGSIAKVGAPRRRSGEVESIVRARSTLLQATVSSQVVLRSANFHP